jgi:hypothetical protein
MKRVTKDIKSGTKSVKCRREGFEISGTHLYFVLTELKWQEDPVRSRLRHLRPCGVRKRENGKGTRDKGGRVYRGRVEEDIWGREEKQAALSNCF